VIICFAIFGTGTTGALQNETGLSFLVSAITTGLRSTPSMICTRRYSVCQSFHTGINRGALPPNHHYGIVPLHRKENVNEGEDVSPVDGLTKSLKYLALS
jgi:hypothetical protein